MMFIINKFSGNTDAKNRWRRKWLKIVEGNNGSVSIEVEGKAYRPAEISAMILGKMKQTAEEYLGEKVTDAVVTVPA